MNTNRDELSQKSSVLLSIALDLKWAHLNTEAVQKKAYDKSVDSKVIDDDDIDVFFINKEIQRLKEDVSTILNNLRKISVFM